MIVPKAAPVPAIVIPAIGPVVTAVPAMLAVATVPVTTAVPAIVAAVIAPDPSTVLIVIVASLAVVAPSNCVPTIVIVSPAAYPEPAAEIATVYVPPSLVTLNVALVPDPLYPDCVGFVWVTATLFTLFIVTVASLAVVAPPNAVPSTVRVSPTL